MTELITWKDYEVQIAAYNSKGVGSYSAAIKVRRRAGGNSNGNSDESLTFRTFCKPVH